MVLVPHLVGYCANQSAPHMYGQDALTNMSCCRACFCFKLSAQRHIQTQTQLQSGMSYDIGHSLQHSTTIGWPN